MIGDFTILRYTAVRFIRLFVSVFYSLRFCLFAFITTHIHHHILPPFTVLTFCHLPRSLFVIRCSTFSCYVLDTFLEHSFALQILGDIVYHYRLYLLHSFNTTVISRFTVSVRYLVRAYTVTLEFSCTMIRFVRVHSSFVDFILELPPIPYIFIHFDYIRGAVILYLILPILTHTVLPFPTLPSQFVRVLPFVTTFLFAWW